MLFLPIYGNMEVFLKCYPKMDGLKWTIPINPISDGWFGSTPIVGNRPATAASAKALSPGASQRCPRCWYRTPRLPQRLRQQPRRCHQVHCKARMERKRRRKKVNIRGVPRGKNNLNSERVFFCSAKIWFAKQTVMKSQPKKSNMHGLSNNKNDITSKNGRSPSKCENQSNKFGF